MPQYGYTTAGGEEISPFIDMINGGGPGRSGERFEGGGIMSLLANLVASPYGSQRQRPGHPAPGTLGVSRDASGGGFQSQLPGEDLMSGMGGTGDEAEDVVPPAIAGDTDMRRTTPYPSTMPPAIAGDIDMRRTTPYTDDEMVPLTDEHYAILAPLDNSLIPRALRDALPGDLVPISALVELRSLVGDDTPAPARMMPRADSMETRASLAQYSPRSPVQARISELAAAGLGQGMASPMATGEGLGQIGDPRFSGIPDWYTMASESIPMLDPNLSVYELADVAALIDVLRGQNPTASEEELRDMATWEVVSRR